jgi:hypothetical protein
MTEIYILACRVRDGIAYPMQIRGFYTSYSLAEEALCVEVQEGLEEFAKFCEVYPKKIAGAIGSPVEAVINIIQLAIEESLKTLKVSPSLETVKSIAKNLHETGRLRPLFYSNLSLFTKKRLKRIENLLRMLMVYKSYDEFFVGDIEIRRFETNERVNYDLKI